MKMATSLRSSGSLLHAVVMVVFLLLGGASPVVGLITNDTVQGCSTTCESAHCGDPFTLRYGKYCGVGYTGCSGQSPCDGLDACCRTHDNCIGSNLENYVNKTCNGNLRTCVEQFKNSSSPTFTGSNCSATEVENVIIVAMDLVTGSTGSDASSPFALINVQWTLALIIIVSAVLLRSQ